MPLPKEIYEQEEPLHVTEKPVVEPDKRYGLCPVAVCRADPPKLRHEAAARPCSGSAQS